MRNTKKLTALIIGLLLTAGIFAETNTGIDFIYRDDLISVCRLATIECDMTDVAHGEKSKKILFIKGSRKFDMQMKVKVTMGIELKDLKIESTESKVRITVPLAKVLSVVCDPSSLTEENFSTEKKRWIKIRAEDRQAAVNAAIDEIRGKEALDEYNLCRAQRRAGEELEAYIKKIFDENNVNKTVEICYE